MRRVSNREAPVQCAPYAVALLVGGWKPPGWSAS